MSGYRSLAPFGSMGESSPSSSAKDSRKESTGPTSGDIGGGDGGDSGKGGGGGLINRRKRAAGTVSHKACSRCRSARQKCDGVEPNPCSKCVQHSVACVWEPHTKESKDDLIQQILVLQTQQRQMKAESARNEEERKEAQQNSEWQATILQTIGSNGHDREITERLREGQSAQTIADWLVAEDPTYKYLGPGLSVRLTMTQVVKMFEEQCQAYDGLLHLDSAYTSKIAWTEVTSDHKLIGHLFDLYFTWVHPVHMLFSEQDFVDEFRDSESKDSKSPYCGPVLVNAICAMACHLLENDTIPPTSKDREHNRSINAARLREAFMKEARAGLTPDTYEEMKSVQAFALMYLVDWSSGKARHGLGYLRSAAEYLKTQYPGHSTEAIEITFWGIRTLITASIGTTYEVIHTRAVPPRTESLGSVNTSRDKEDLWGFYRQPGDEKEMPKRLKNGMITTKYRTDLFRLADQVLRLYCGSFGSVTAKSILNLYRGLLKWEDGLPDVLRIDSEDTNPLPHVSSLHIQLHAIIVQLLNPLAQGHLFEATNLLEIRASIAYHAWLGIRQVEETAKLYTARFFLPVLIFSCVHLADAVMFYDPPKGPHALRTVMEVLQHARSGFDVCGPLQGLLYRRANLHRIKPPSDIQWIVDALPQYGLDEIIDACTRPAFTQPMNQIHPTFDDDLAGEWARSEASRILLRSSPAADRMQIDSLLNVGE